MKYSEYYILYRTIIHIKNVYNLIGGVNDMLFIYKGTSTEIHIVEIVALFY